jgi:hypothetical protein
VQASLSKNRPVQVSLGWQAGVEHFANALMQQKITAKQTKIVRIINFFIQSPLVFRTKKPPV